MLSFGKTVLVIIVFYILAGFLLWIANRSSKKAYQEVCDEYDEATKWYESLSDAKKAEIMDRFWYNHPTYHNGKRYMASIYKYYTNKGEK